MGSFPPAFQDPASPVKPPKVAVLVRTHVVSEKLFDLLHMLSTSRRYELFVAADETRGPLDTRGFAKLAHDAAMCARFGLVDYHPNVMWHCGDYALYFSEALAPGYDYYIMIEYDVDFVRRSPEFLDRFITKLIAERDAPLGLVAARYDGAHPDWCWTAAAQRVYPQAYFTGIFAFMCVSQAALRFLKAERQREARNRTPVGDIIHCEAFCGTAAAAGGFRNLAIESLLPGVISFDSFHNPGLDREQPFYALDYHRVADPAIEMVHPVFDFETYLGKQLAMCRQRRTLDAFLRELSRITPLCGRDAELITTYRAEAMALLPDGAPS